MQSLIACRLPLASESVGREGRISRSRRQALPGRIAKQKRTFMNELVYPRERSLGAITLVIGVLLWLAVKSQDVVMFC